MATSRQIDQAASAARNGPVATFRVGVVVGQAEHVQHLIGVRVQRGATEPDRVPARGDQELDEGERMSLITHRCTKCGHPDYWRLAQKNGRCPDRICRCVVECTPGDPEVVPTYGLDGQPVERVIKPGDPLVQGVPTCGCTACKALYDSLTGAAV